MFKNIASALLYNYIVESNWSRAKFVYLLSQNKENPICPYGNCTISNQTYIIGLFPSQARTQVQLKIILMGKVKKTTPLLQGVHLVAEWSLFCYIFLNVTV